MTILEMSVGGTLLIAAILVLRRIALYRLPKWSFLLLWVVALFRLLIPFSVPSQFSIYTGAAWIAQILEQEESPSEPDGEQPSVMLSPATVSGTFREDAWLPSDVPATPAALVPDKESVSLLTAVYLLGGALCGLFFVIAYGKKMRCFNEAEPVDSDFLNQWQEEHPTMLPVKIKTCDAISSPMAYGLLWPVVLLPENTDWSDEDQLTYVLTHEYVHIRRGDLGWKLLLTAALCLHWFNPLVWIMYFRANQDLELACDEAVVRILGLDNRKNYAYALLTAAESGFSPFCLTYTTKNHMEERIRAIMKMKKKSTAVIVCAAMLVAGVSAVFATSPKPVEAKDIEDLPSAVMTTATTTPAPAPMEQNASQNTPAASDASTVHQTAPTTPDTSTAPQTTPVTPEQNMEPVQKPVDTSTEPVADTTEPNTAPTAEISVCTICTRYYDYPEDHIHPDAATPYAANCWGIPEGPIAEKTEIFAHNEVEYREMIRQLRMMGYAGPVSGPIQYKCGKFSAVLEADYDGVARTLQAPEGIMPDWTYPINSKGITYGTLGTSKGVLGYYPDLIAVKATNGVSGYIPANESFNPQSNITPVYDVDCNNIVGYFTFDSGKGNMDLGEKLEMLETEFKKWGWSEDEIAKGLSDYKQAVRYN